MKAIWCLQSIRVVVVVVVVVEVLNSSVNRITTVTEYYINDKHQCYSLLYSGQVSVEYLHWQEHKASLCAGLKKKGKNEGLQRGI